jgi:hypothetical protein
MTPTGRIAVLLLVLSLAGCATAPRTAQTPASTPIAPQAVLRSLALDPKLEDQILALDPLRVSDSDVRTVLATAPAPHVVGLHGGVYPTHLLMESFARFLQRMGYPEAKLRHPGDGRRSHSPYEDSAQIAGLLAWYYEHEGVRPLLIGHSQGGVQVVKVLHELAARNGRTIRVWNPLTDAAEDRVMIIDPLTGVQRPVVGLTLGYASVVAAGGAALLLPNQWSMVAQMRTVPDSIEEFTGYSLGVDLIAWNLPGAATIYHTNGAARVRNVELPADYSHITVVAVAGLARDPAMRQWLNDYAPGMVPPLPAAAEKTDHALWAADVWYSIKKHWVLEAQKLIKARRSLAAAQ